MASVKRMPFEDPMRAKQQMVLAFSVISTKTNLSPPVVREIKEEKGH